MRRFFPATLLFLVVMETFAGGLVTKTSQSPQYARMLSRNASTDLDAVYFNPAGLSFFENGWYYSVNNQMLLQNKTISTDYPGLGNRTYSGESMVFINPSLFALYKIERWGLSFGYGLVSGGYIERYPDGIPTFDLYYNKQMDLDELGITDYTRDIDFSAKSYTHGFQTGVTFSVSDNFSVYGGVRIMPATRDYELSVADMKAQVNGEMIQASSYYKELGTTLIEEGGKAGAVAEQLQQKFLSIGAGIYDLKTLQQAGYLTEAEKNKLLAGLQAIQVNGAEETWTMNKVWLEYDRVSTSFQTRGARYLAASTDFGYNRIISRQRGLGLSPIVGFNLDISDALNVSIRYEHRSRMKLTSLYNNDNSGLLTEGTLSKYVIPTLLAFGIGYKTEGLGGAQFSYNIYSDRFAGWGNNFRESLFHGRTVKRTIDNNTVELSLGLEFEASPKIALSMGGLWTNHGVADSFQSDFSFANPTTTLGGGLKWIVTEKLTFDAGLMYTSDRGAVVTFSDPEIPTGEYHDSYGSNSIGFSFGFTYSIYE